jgi:hypothetical protein
VEERDGSGRECNRFGDAEAVGGCVNEKKRNHFTEQVEFKGEATVDELDFKIILMRRIDRIGEYKCSGEHRRYKNAVEDLESKLKGYLIDNSPAADDYRKAITEAEEKKKRALDNPPTINYNFQRRRWDEQCAKESTDKKYDALMIYMKRKGFLPSENLG